MGVGAVPSAPITGHALVLPSVAAGIAGHPLLLWDDDADATGATGVRLLLLAPISLIRSCSLPRLLSSGRKAHE